MVGYGFCFGESYWTPKTEPRCVGSLYVISEQDITWN